jgi:hypothetical protein
MHADDLKATIRTARLRFCAGEVWRSPMGNFYRVLDALDDVVDLGPIEQGRGRWHRCKATLTRGWTLVQGATE